MTRPGGLLPRTPEDGAKDDDDNNSVDIDDILSIHDDAASHSTLSEEDSSIVGKQRARRKWIRRNFAIGLVGYGGIVMAVCLVVNIVVGRGGH